MHHRGGERSGLQNVGPHGPKAMEKFVMYIFFSSRNGVNDDGRERSSPASGFLTCRTCQSLAVPSVEAVRRYGCAAEPELELAEVVDDEKATLVMSEDP